MQAISVSVLNDQIKYTLEATFLQVAVEGEISRPTYHGSGHVYFSIKDSDASVKAVMFKGNAVKLKFRLEEGLKVILYGAITVYKPRGEYQLNVSSVEPAGVGNLALAFEQLKQKLSGLGYFEDERKKVKPKVISSLVLITSATGAALQDMLRVISKRWPMVKITLIDVLVQGEKASSEIAQAIKHADRLDVDAIVIARGGGSVEDLWAFNEEDVAQALFGSKTFTVSAVGHEIDWVISDYVADMRATTPSAAMELLLSDQWELRQYMDQLADHANAQFNKILFQKSQELAQLKSQFEGVSIDKRLESVAKSIRQTQDELTLHMRQRLHYFQEDLTRSLRQLNENMQMRFQGFNSNLVHLQRAYESADPALRDKKGLAQVRKNSELIELQQLTIGDTIELSSSKAVVNATITGKRLL